MTESLFFIGDEVTAAGFRLAGLTVFQPRPRELPELFARLCREARLILMTAEVAADLPAERLRQVQLKGWPLLLVIPDIRGRVPAQDLVAVLRRQLGLAE